MSEHPLHDLAMEIRYSLTEAQGKLTEMMRQIGDLEPPAPSGGSFMNGPVSADCCPECGIGGREHTADCSRRGDPVPWPVEPRVYTGRGA